MDELVDVLLVEDEVVLDVVELEDVVVCVLLVLDVDFVLLVLDTVELEDVVDFVLLVLLRELEEPRTLGVSIFYPIMAHQQVALEALSCLMMRTHEMKSPSESRNQETRNWNFLTG